MNIEKNFTTSGHPRHAGITDALALVAKIREGVRSAFVFEHGSMQVKMYRPTGSDPQKPHTRDEVYIVARGSGWFINGADRHAFQSGDMLFVPAGVEHRFDEFTADFCTWVMFYGPEGERGLTEERGLRTGKKNMKTTNHQALIVDQFSKQAIAFSTAKTIADAKALQLLIDAVGAGPEDTVLDVACGGGNVVCAFAGIVRHATGIDMTPAMLDHARAMARERKLDNVSWGQGQATALPYADGTFTIVVTRFSFHHFIEPLAVLREMVRVCAPGGRVLVADMHTSTDPAKGAEFNRMEGLRDPSHVRALPVVELKALFPAAGLPEAKIRFYELRDELENLLGRSFPNPGDGDKIREIFRTSARDDRLGIPVRLEGSHVNYAYPVAVLAATRP